MKRKFVLMAPLAAALLLAACGGSGGGGDNSPVAEDDTTVPASATESPESFSRWVASRPANDVKEPLLVMGVLPPTTDIAEPIDVN